MQSFVDLQAWQVGMRLVKEVYWVTKSFPLEEQRGITSQIRRAATAILANLAEGFSRSGGPDKAYKYTIARGECAEVHALLLVAQELKLINDTLAVSLIELALETGKLLNGLVQKFHIPSPSPKP